MNKKQLSIAILLVLFASILFNGTSVGSSKGSTANAAAPDVTSKQANADRLKVTKTDFLGEVSFPTGYAFQGTEVGGISALVYDPLHKIYYALSDDRSQVNPARFYTLSIKANDGALTPGDVEFRGVTFLRNANGETYPALALDPEGITLSATGTLFVSSEGDVNARPQINPFVNEYSLDGNLLAELPIPARYLPTLNQSGGIRNNLAFESLTTTPSKQALYTAVENALYQDGPAASPDQGSLARILKYDFTNRQPVQEYVYPVDPVPAAPVPAGSFSTNGLVELLATDNNGSFLALERGFSTGVGNSVRLFEVNTQGALDVFSADSLFWAEEGVPFEVDPTVQKRELVDFSDFVVPDNIEALTFGPRLSDGRQIVIVASDNNFSSTQVTQFIALAVTFETIPAVLPVLETPYTLNDVNAPQGILGGDSDDPAIWVNPNDPDQSRVIATLKDGGLAVFDLDGALLQHILPAPYGDIRYNNVDLIYNFALNGKAVDLAVVSDRANDTLAIFAVDPQTLLLSDVTSTGIPETIFGVDDGSHTVYGLATYSSPVSGKAYVFVCQREGNLVAQLELFDDGAGRVSARTVRTLELPVPTGDPEDSQAEGMVVDREYGVLYVGIEGEVGIVKTGAEPGTSGNWTLVQPIDASFLKPDIEGLTIYYGCKGRGYLLVSSQGDSSFGVLERAGDNRYLGSFVVGDHGSIDQVNESDGADVVSSPLGSRFPFGLLVVQDGANDPQNLVQDDEQLENNSTNFKFIRWDDLASAFPQQLQIAQGCLRPSGK